MNLESLWPSSSGYAGRFEMMTRIGIEAARSRSICVVGIARNACPYIKTTLETVKSLAPHFGSLRMFVYENDSTDGTDAALDDFASAHQWLEVQHDTLGAPDARGFEKERTERLARCRNVCFDWVKSNASETDWTIVLDMDPHGGFDAAGVFNSIGCLASETHGYKGRRAGAMAAYSLYAVVGRDGERRVAHYDAWAARPLCWWEDRRESTGGMAWFSTFMPPVGAPPMPMNSAFGGLCVYYTPAFLSGGYSGEDCEHVPHHRRMQQAGWQLYLNPGCKYFAFFSDESDS